MENGKLDPRPRPGALVNQRGVLRNIPVRAIAFYLPQYHPIPENDAWWGVGFTEWTNVVRARPQFTGHEQPHLPGELGFYDLRLPEVRERQAALARANGIYGFCYHYYWFGGRRLLERPLDEVHRLGTPDLPFCVSWANENWSRRWDGGEDEVLIAQAHSPSDDEALLRSLLPLFKDKRYIRVGERPLFLVYRPDILPDAADTIARWRAICTSEGLAEPYFVGAQSFGTGDPTVLGFDAAVEFPPHGFSDADIPDSFQTSHPSFNGRVFDYEKFARRAVVRPPCEYTRFRTVMPSWDNTPRRKSSGSIFVGSSPRLYEWWLGSAVALAQHELPDDRRLVFINAWNEWGEGCHLEPDERYGDAYLRATRTVLTAANTSSLTPLVSVVVPTCDRARMLCEGLQTIVEQTYDNIEIIIVDAGSRDETVHVLKSFCARYAGHRIRVMHTTNGSVFTALNDGIRAAEGKYVALFEDGGRFNPDRLLRVVYALRGARARFAFSACTYIDSSGQPVGPDDPLATTLRRKQRRIVDFPSLGYALLDFNVTVSAGNFFFERSLFEDVGDFAELRHRYDWDWALRTLRFGDPLFIDSVLYEHRFYHAHERDSLDHLANLETASVLSRFFAADPDVDEAPPGYPGRRNFGDYHEQFIREHGYSRYLPKDFAHPAEANDASDIA